MMMRETESAKKYIIKKVVDLWDYIIYLKMYFIEYVIFIHKIFTFI